MSARYIKMPDENYIPSIQRIMINAGTNNKQAGTISDSQQITEPYAKAYQGQLKDIYTDLEHHYQDALSSGVPKELARLIIPVGRYSKMRASANLRNWLAFLTLRMDPAAQWEIRQYAYAVGTIICELFPRTWKLFRGVEE
jgi:thymidylate synthase (FAD)